MVPENIESVDKEFVKKGGVFSPNEYLPQGLWGYCKNSVIRAVESAVKYNKRRTGLVVYSAVNTKLGLVRLTNKACIADLIDYRRYYKDEGDPLLIVYDLKLGEDPKRRAFLEYLTERSFLKYAYVYKDLFNVSTGTMVSNCYMPKNYLALANNVLRLGIENSERVKTWHSLVQGGLEEDAAFALSCCNVRVRGGLVSFYGEFLDRYNHSILRLPDNKLFIRALTGNTPLNSLYSENETFIKAKSYKGAWGDVSDGDHNCVLLNSIKAILEHKVVEQPAVLDLMGEVVTPPKSAKGYCIKEINKLWRDCYVNEQQEQQEQ